MFFIPFPNLIFSHTRVISSKLVGIAEIDEGLK